MKILKKVDMKELEALKSKVFEKEIQTTKKDSLEEAFRSGKAGEVIQKVASILTRKIGKKVTVGVLPTGYENSDGKFLSFKGYAGNMPIRFNFLLNSSDVLYSIDLYEKPTSIIPTKTIQLNGYNIVQIIDMVADVFTGEFDRYLEEVESDPSKDSLDEKRRLQERITLQEMMVAWFETNPSLLSDIKNNRFDFQARSDDFVLFIQRTYNSSKKSMSLGSFQYTVRKTIEDTPSLNSVVNAKSVPAVNVVPGVPDKASLLIDKEAKEAYEAAVSDDAVEKFKIIEEKARAIAQGKQFAVGMFVYGRPGTGKTFTIEQILDEEGADWVAIKGGIDGSDALLAILYTYRDDKVILFDDNDAVFGSAKAITVLKIALENKPIRNLGFGMPLKYGTGNERVTVPANFEFNSRVIFISNKTTIDPAIQSRLIGALIELDFTLDQMYDLIKSRLPGILAQYSEITNDDRYTVWDFLEKIKPVAEDIDFRRYEACLQEYLAAKDSGTNAYWQKRCAQILTLPKTWG